MLLNENDDAKTVDLAAVRQALAMLDYAALNYPYLILDSNQDTANTDWSINDVKTILEITNE